MHGCLFFFQESSDNPNPIAKAELNLLAHLVVGSSKKHESMKKYIFLNVLIFFCAIGVSIQ